jgi:hypothetical protein
VPRIFDNIELLLLPELRQALELSYRADCDIIGGWSAGGHRSSLPISKEVKP